MSPRDNVRVTGTLLLLIVGMAITGVGTSLMLIDDKMVLCLVAAAMVFTVMSTVLLTCYFLEIKTSQQNQQRRSSQCRDIETELAIRSLHGNSRFSSGLRITSGAPLVLNTPTHFLNGAEFAGMFRTPTLAQIAMPPPPPIESLPRYSASSDVPSTSTSTSADSELPPTYLDSNEYENNRIQNHSNAPPAYDTFHENPDNNNFASFSPPPFYRPATPDFSSLRSVQTATLYLSPERRNDSPSSERSVSDTTVTRVLSPLPANGKFRRSKARVHCTVSANLGGSALQNVTVSLSREDGRESDEEAGPSSPSSAETSTSSRQSMNDDEIAVTSNREIEEIQCEQPQISPPQMFIDCSKPEPTIFTINRDESII